MALHAAQGPLTDKVRVHEFIKAELWQPYCRTAGTIQNTATATVVAGGFVVGMALVRLSLGVWRIALAADTSVIHGWLIDQRLNEALANGATSKDKYQILERGPAFIDQDKLVLLDPDGGAVSLANQQTALAAVSPPIRTFLEPATIQTQTT